MEALPRILFVDEEIEFLPKVIELLHQSGFQTSILSTIAGAIDLLTRESFALVISDMRMPDKTGIDLLRWIRQHKPNTKLVFSTTMTDIADRMKPSDLGCDGIITKPLRPQPVLDAVRAVFKVVATAEVGDFDFASICITDVIEGGGRVYPYDLYLRLQDRRFLKIAHFSDTFDADRLVQLKTRGVEQIWLKREDFQKHLQSNLGFIKASSLEAARSLGTAVAGAPAVADLRGYAGPFMHACAIATENLRIAGISPESLAAAQVTLEAALSLLMQDPMAPALMELIQNGPPSIHHHAVAAGLLTALIGRIMKADAGAEVERDQQDLALGGFLHDVGMYRLPASLQTADPEKMGAAELREYHEHVTKGWNELNSIHSLSKSVLTTVLQHHEDVRGTGFPGALKVPDLSPQARVVAVVDMYIDHLLRLTPALRVKGQELLKALVERQRGRYDPRVVAALELALGVSDPHLAEAAYRRQMKVVGSTEA